MIKENEKEFSSAMDALDEVNRSYIFHKGKLLKIIEMLNTEGNYCLIFNKKAKDIIKDKESEFDIYVKMSPEDVKYFRDNFPK